ncbi:hypothetical protein KJZ61_03880 [Candidatus Dependentiae bacterium]|nr:hypothetical protein [Candidatus Dependentiae bacterium]
MKRIVLTAIVVLMAQVETVFATIVPMRNARAEGTISVTVSNKTAKPLQAWLSWSLDNWGWRSTQKITVDNNATQELTEIFRLLPMRITLRAFLHVSQEGYPEAVKEIINQQYQADSYGVYVGMKKVFGPFKTTVTSHSDGTLSIDL